MTFWLVTVAFLAGLAAGVVMLARLVKRYTDEIEGLLADLFDQVRYRDKDKP